jgi:uncharacterized membrane protein YccC
VRMRIHDPGGLATRRATRVAIALPIALAFTLVIAEGSMAPVFTLFGTIALLINADFAGSFRGRATSYVCTGVAGSIALPLGWFFSATMATAVAGTMVVFFVLTILGVMRGPISVAIPSIQIIFVLAVCMNHFTTSLIACLVGWWVAVAVSTITALLVLPRYRESKNRTQLAEAFNAAASAATAAWIGDRDNSGLVASVASFDKALDGLDSRDAAQAARASDIGSRHAALESLATSMVDLRLLLVEGSSNEAPEQIDDFPARSDLAEAIVKALSDLAQTMNDPKFIPSAVALDAAHTQINDAVEEGVLSASLRGMGPTQISQWVASVHQLRIFALLIEQLTEMARLANGADTETLRARIPVPTRSLRLLLSSQLHISSPWFRNAMRTSVGLGIGVLAMRLTGVDHGFWVLLGVISALRLDAVGTRKQAILAITGTFIGVGLGLLITIVIVTSPAILWILLPLVTFMSAWTSGAVGFFSGQVSISTLILVALGILNWPPQASAGFARIEDIALGSLVALLVGALMWRRGAVVYLRSRIANSLRASTAYFGCALQAFAGPDEKQKLEQAQRESTLNNVDVAETYEMALSQNSPGQNPRVWESCMTFSTLVASAARISGMFAQDNPIYDLHPQLVPAVDRALKESADQWGALANRIDPTMKSPTELPPIANLNLPTLTPIVTKQDAHALLIAVSFTGWVIHLSRAAHLVEARLADSAAQIMNESAPSEAVARI